jgi:fucose 4-O-acetylase-like acetyltransferase
VELTRSRPVGLSTGRTTWVDQVRWVAIVLVVTGHLIGLVRGRSDAAELVSDYLYVFHVPAFVLLAGWSSRRARLGTTVIVRIWWQLVAPYLVFQLIAFGLEYLLDGVTPSWSFSRQTFGLWFLVALAGWRALGALLRPLPVPVALLLSLTAALLAGVVPAIGDQLSLSRILVFLPLFVAGPWVIDQVDRWRKRVELRLAALAVMVAGFVVVAADEPGFSRVIFFGRDGYEALGYSDASGAAHRLAALAISLTVATCFCVVVPGAPGAPTRLGRWVATAGRHTMYAYLLHLPIRLVLAWTGWLGDGPPWVCALAALALGPVLTTLLVTRPVRALTRPLVEPRTLVGRVSRQQAPSVPPPAAGPRPGPGHGRPRRPSGLR